MEFKHNGSIQQNSNYVKNFGYSILSSIYHELAIDKFLISRQRNSKEKFNANTIMKMLVYSRLLTPASKKILLKTKPCFLRRIIIP